MVETQALWERLDYLFRRVFFHVIQRDDTFYSLARRYGVDVDDIIRLNPCADPENLQVGQIVAIPCPRRPRREDLGF